jgi:hypothetical protein
MADYDKGVGFQQTLGTKGKDVDERHVKVKQWALFKLIATIVFLKGVL